MSVVGLVLAVLLAADPSPAGEDGDDVRSAVEKWIKQLDSAVLIDRSRAERELLDLGPRILPLLPPSELVKGTAARDGVNRLRVQLQRRLAKDSVQPSRFSISQELPLPDLLAELHRQTRNRVELDDNVPEKFRASRKWNLDRVTFWEAIDVICREASLSPVSQGDREGLLLASLANRSAPLAVIHQGVLRGEIHAVSLQDIQGDSARKLLRLQGELTLEPRLRPLFVHFKAGDFSVTDEKGASPAAWNPQARYEFPLAGASRRARLNWDFVIPADDQPQQLTLRGRILVQLAAATEQIRFNELTSKQEILRRRGGVSVRLHHVDVSGEREDRKSVRVKVTVSYDTGGPAFESHRTWVYHNAAWLEAAGKRFPYADFDALLQTDGNVQLEYRFPELPSDKPFQFVYEAPTLLLDVPLELEFAQVKWTSLK